MSGGVVSGAVCGDVPTADVADLVVSVEQGFGNTPVFFDPTLTPKTPVPVVATSGPSAEGTLSADRATPIALGTVTDIGEGWTLTINGADLDATETVLGYSEYNEVPMSGQRFVLLDVSMTYNGEDEPATAAFVDIGLVGDGNVTSAVGSCQATIEGELDRYSDLYIGGTIDGAVCAVVAEADVDSLVAVATVGYGEDPFVLAVR